MSNESEVRQRFEQFSETGETHAFRFRSGQNFQGWVIEVGEEAILVMWAPSPFYAQATGSDEMSPPDEWVKFSDIEPSSLSYWDDTAGLWIDYSDAYAR
jgi:hypothetical protein